MKRYFFVTRAGIYWVLTYEQTIIFRDKDIAKVIKKGKATAKEYTPSILIIKNEDASISSRTEY
jgi:hypothetical protein